MMSPTACRRCGDDRAGPPARRGRQRPLPWRPAAARQRHRHTGLYHRGLLERARAQGAAVGGPLPCHGRDAGRRGFPCRHTQGRGEARDVFVAQRLHAARAPLAPAQGGAGLRLHDGDRDPGACADGEGPAFRPADDRESRHAAMDAPNEDGTRILFGGTTRRGGRFAGRQGPPSPPRDDDRGARSGRREAHPLLDRQGGLQLRHAAPCRNPRGNPLRHGLVRGGRAHGGPFWATGPRSESWARRRRRRSTTAASPHGPSTTATPGSCRCSSAGSNGATAGRCGARFARPAFTARVGEAADRRRRRSARTAGAAGRCGGRRRRRECPAPCPPPGPRAAAAGRPARAPAR